MEYLLQLLISGVAVGSIYALIALGFVLIYKATGIFNFAQGELVMVGTYTALALVQSGLALPVAIPLALGLSFVLGIVLERAFLRPMVGEPAVSVIMLTIGLALMLRSATGLIWGPSDRVFPPMFSQAPLAVGSVNLSRVHLAIAALALACFALFSFFFMRTRVGLEMRAVASNQDHALLLGVSVGKIFSLSWGIACAVATLGGVFLGNFITVNLNMNLLGLQAFPAAVLGGLDSVAGVVAGGLIIGVVESLAGGYLDPLVGGGIRGVKQVAGFVILVAILLLRPYGLFGTKDVERV